MSRPLVLFDYDGVLINTFLDALAASHDIGVEMSADEYREMFKGNIYTSVKKRFAGISDDLNARFTEAFGKRTQHLVIPSSMCELISALSLRYTLCIVSSGSESIIKRQLLNSHLLDCFTDVMGHETDTSKVVKIRSALRMYGSGRETCVFVTDTLGDIKEAQEVGVHTIAVTWGFHDEETLQEGNPESLVRTPSELQEKIESLF